MLDDLSDIVNDYTRRFKKKPRRDPNEPVTNELRQILTNFDFTHEALLEAVADVEAAGADPHAYTALLTCLMSAADDFAELDSKEITGVVDTKSQKRDAREAMAALKKAEHKQEMRRDEMMRLLADYINTAVEIKNAKLLMENIKRRQEMKREQSAQSIKRKLEMAEQVEQFKKYLAEKEKNPDVPVPEGILVVAGKAVNPKPNDPDPNRDDRNDLPIPAAVPPKPPSFQLAPDRLIVDSLSDGLERI